VAATTSPSAAGALHERAEARDRLGVDEVLPVDPEHLARQLALELTQRLIDDEPTAVAALVAALSSFVIGGMWYSPILFAKAWQREAGLTDAQLRTQLGKTFTGAFLLSLVIAANLAAFLGQHAGIAWGAGAGALAGIGWAAASLATVFLFERRSAMLIVIEGGYLAVSYTVMGAIIGAWP
jgi:hypothetical protein